MKVKKISYWGTAVFAGVTLAVVYVFCMAVGLLTEAAWVPLWRLVFPSYMGFPGFDTTAVGLLAGFIWSLVDGAFMGLAAALVYNNICSKITLIEFED